jgi:hypothetical protein
MENHKRVKALSKALGGFVSSYRRKSAACLKFDMVWINSSPFPEGRRE